MKSIKYLVLMAVILYSIAFIPALTWYPVPVPVSPPININVPNATINVDSNDSWYLRGLSPQQVANLYVETDPIFTSWLGTNVYCHSDGSNCVTYYPLNNPSGFYNSTTIPAYCYSNGTNSSGVNCINVTSITNSLYAPISVTGDNSSWNQSFANTLYANFSSFNSTQMTYSGGYINILTSWINSLWCSLTGCTMSGNINMNQNNVTNITYIKMQEKIGACDLTINHSICSNASGSYWIG